VNLFQKWRGGAIGAVLATALVLTGCNVLPKSPAVSVGELWLAAWGSAQLEQFPAPAAHATPDAWQLPLRDVSLRQVVRLHAEGDALRVRVSNVFGRQALQLGAASISLVVPAEADSSPAQQPILKGGSLRALTFSGHREVSVAAGDEVWSDPVELSVSPQVDLAVQLHIVSQATPATVHPGSRINSWAIAGNHVDSAVWAGAMPREGWMHLAAVDVRVSRPVPVLVAIGDSITDGYGVPSGSNQRWTDFLSHRLAASGGASIINSGIGGNRLLRNGLGPSAMSRFERDVLDRSGVTHAIALIGVNDLGGSHRDRATTPESRAALLAELKTGYSDLVRRAHERGVCLIGATVMPYGGSSYYKPEAENEADRQALNEWIRRSGIFDAVVDFDAISRDPDRPSHLRAEYDNDGLHPSVAGYRAMAETFPLEVLDRRCSGPATSFAAPASASTSSTIPASFSNPVISGFASDPSVCRSGEDYYLVTSTFEYLPGLPIYHSRDLVNWRLIGNALSRASQINFIGRKSSQSIFAPTIR
jgi:lysophospholipase L1-like esterase